MDIALIDIDLVQEFLMDSAVAALLLVFPDRVIFIDAADFHVGERNLALLLVADQFPVKGDWRGAGSDSEPEFTVSAVSDSRDYGFSNFCACIRLVVEDFRRNLFITVKNVIGQTLFDKPSVFW